jgi:hypothetical protein
MTTGGILLATLFVLIGIWRTGTRFVGELNSMFNPSPAIPQVDVRSVVVRQVKNASELTTAVFTMEAVVPTSQDRKLGEYVIGTTRLLYIAYGEVKAGVDLSQLKADNVQIVNDTILLRLPPPRILDSKIDVNRSKVYDYDRGFLGLGPDVAPQLQTLAQQETLLKIITAACSQGLLKQANDRAELVVSQLLNVAGYKEVLVETTSPPPESCK